jgi:hypothetical protein
MHFFIRSLFLLLSAGLLFGAGPSVSRLESVPPADLREGDIVVRSGKGFISRIFRNASISDKKYSHCGIVTFRQGKAIVVHFIDEQGKKAGMHFDSFESFSDPEHNNAFAVYRYDFMQANQEKLQLFILQTQQKEISFDDRFDLETDDQFYCSEFVFKAILNSTGKRLPVTKLNGRNYVAPDNLYLNPYSTCIFKSGNPDS